MNTILVTGVTGLLGSNLVKVLIANKYNVISSVRADKVSSYMPQLGEVVISDELLFEGKFPKVDVIVNCAFARSNESERLASALDFTTKLINGLKIAKVYNVINISSQGVYKRLPVGQLSKENSPISPIDLYSIAKYASENLFIASGIPYVTNIRLASLNMRQRFLYSFIQSAKNEGVIHVNSPKVYASLLDVNDAVNAILSILQIQPLSWAPVYNVGTGNQTSLLEYAKIVKKVGLKLGYKVNIIIDDNDYTSTSGADISLIYNDTGWRPNIKLEDMIENMFNV